MNTVHTCGLETGGDESVWLELRLDGESHTFELAADESRAITVGSLMRADLRIDRPGVGPVHFHIEREADAVWVVPAYCSRDLRVNAAQLTGPKPIDGHAIIEFSDIRLDAYIIDKHSVVNYNLLTAPVEQLFTASKAVLAQPTIRMPSLCADGAPPARSVVAIQPHRIVSLSIETGDENAPATLRTGQCPVQAPVTNAASNGQTAALTQDTVRMLPFWMMESEREPQESEITPSSAGDPAPRAPAQPGAGSRALTFATEQLAPLFLQIAETTYFGPVRSPENPQRVSDPPQCTTVFDIPRIDAQNWFARLGVLSKRRPLLVWLVGTITAFVVSAALTSASKYLQRTARSLGGHQDSPTSSLPLH